MGGTRLRMTDFLAKVSEPLTPSNMNAPIHNKSPEPLPSWQPWGSLSRNVPYFACRSIQL